MTTQSAELMVAGPYNSPEIYRSVRERSKGAITQSYDPDLDALYVTITKAGELTDFQQAILKRLFTEFAWHQDFIDSKKLKAFKHSFNEDGDLILYRQNSNGVTSLIINDWDVMALSIIRRDIPSSLQQFTDPLNSCEFEDIIYDFFK